MPQLKMQSNQVLTLTK